MSIAWALFVPACFALNPAPGPNNLLSLNNAARHGFATASLAGGGRLLAFAGMLALVASGLALVLHTSAWLFLAIAARRCLPVVACGAIVAGRCAATGERSQPSASQPLAPGAPGVPGGGGQPESDPDLHRLPAAVRRSRPTAGRPVRPARRGIPAARMAGHRSLFLCRAPPRPAARRPAGPASVQSGCAALLGSAGLGLLLSRRPA